jgi:hypothetical protein
MLSFIMLGVVVLIVIWWNDTQHGNIQHNDTLLSDTQHNHTQHNNKKMQHSAK